MVPAMSSWRDGERTPKHNNGTSMRKPRLSRITTGRLVHLTFNQMDNQPTLESSKPTQDGGNSSDTKALL
jgi:hypothetical protein